MFKMYAKELTGILSVQLYLIVLAFGQGNSSMEVCPENTHFLEENGKCKECGKCLGGATCERLYGACPSGQCQLWYAPGRYCYEYIPAKATYLSLSYLSGGPLLPFVSHQEIEVKFDLINSIPVELLTFYVYKIQYAKSDESLYTELDDVIRYQEDSAVIRIYNLMPNTIYKIRVALYIMFNNSIYGLVEHSNARYAKTICANPEAVQITTIENTNSGVRLTWTPFKSACNSIKSAVLRYKESHLDESAYTSIDLGTNVQNNTGAVIRGLSYNTNYNFHIVLTNDQDMATVGQTKLFLVQNSFTDTSDHRVISVAKSYYMATAMLACVTCLLLLTTVAMTAFFLKQRWRKQPVSPQPQGNVFKDTYETIPSRAEEQRPLSERRENNRMEAAAIRDCNIDIAYDSKTPMNVDIDGYLVPTCHASECNR